MSKPLVIVESPTKVKTISKILGDEYVVKSSVGHIRDLPRNTKSIPSSFKKEDILWGAVKPNQFENIYVIPEDRKKIVNELKDLADKAPDVYLATDDDREGEAIAYHLKESLELKNEPKRIKFNEITDTAVLNAMKNPEKIDIGKFKSYEARRTLDRMIGYEISPKLRDLGGAFISTGRVQGPAIRLIVEREEERLSFIKSEYFEIKADCKSLGFEFKSNLKSLNGIKISTSKDFDKEGKKISKDRRYLNEEEARDIVNILKNSVANISNIKESQRTGKPPKPFKTTSLQTSARNNLGFQPGKTMGIAQKLYQEGLITYMRTDSIRLSDIAIKASRKYIQSNFSKEHLPSTPNYFGDSKNAQAAHEAIRPSGEKFKTPEELLNKYKEDTDEYRLYELIFNITIASQMSEARGVTKTIDIEVNDEIYETILLGISGTTWVFGGYRDIAKNLSEQSQELPNLKKGDKVEIINSEYEQKFTNPPNRYSSTSLINKLEELGIGRPSTYVSIIQSITSVFINSDSSLKPRIIAMAMINNFMKPYFDPYINYKFSKEMEDKLDEILESKSPEEAKIDFLKDSYEKIQKHVNKYGEPDPISLTSYPLPFDTRYVLKTGRVQDRIAYPYLQRDDDFYIGLPPDITIEELDETYINEGEKQQEANLLKERRVCDCKECETPIFIKLGPGGGYYFQHGIKEKGIRQPKCPYRNMIGPIFEDEDPDLLGPEDAYKRFNLSTKNPRLVCEENGWSYMTAVGPYGGFAIKQRNREVFDINDLKEMKKNEIVELVNSEKYQKIMNLINGEAKNIPKSLNKDELLERIKETYLINEKSIKKLSKDSLVNLAKLLDIVFYRGRFRMKTEDATKNNLINKIVIDKKNKPLETPQKALTIDSSEILNVFGDSNN